MQYTFDLLTVGTNARIATDSTFKKATENFNKHSTGSVYLVVTDNLKPMNKPEILCNAEDLRSFEEALERSFQWNPKKEEKKDHINPSHYASYFGGLDDVIEELQWLEAKQYQNHWKKPENFIAAVLLQADKYLSRLGGKDEMVQEILKGIWYLHFVAAYIKNDSKPIRVKDIESILKGS